MFEEQEIYILLEALECWEKDAFQSHFMTSLLMGGLISEKDKRDDFLSERHQEFESQKDQRKAAKERSIIIKAKLIQLRDKEIAQSAAKFMGIVNS